MYSKFVYPEWSCWVGWEQTVKVDVEFSLPYSLLGVFIVQAWFSSTFSANTKTNDFAPPCAYDNTACIAPRMRQRLIKKKLIHKCKRNHQTIFLSRLESYEDIVILKLYQWTLDLERIYQNKKEYSISTSTK